MVLYELMHTGSGFAVRQVPAALRFFLNRTKFDLCVSPHAVKNVCLSAKGLRRSGIRLDSRLPREAPSTRFLQKLSQRGRWGLRS